jgi:hypothetical protein
MNRRCAFRINTKQIHPELRQHLGLLPSEARNKLDPA